MTPADQSARDVVAAALDRTLFVEAGAGTGKTTALVARVTNAVATGKLPEIASLAAITFTENAAAELRTRIRESLKRRAVSPQPGDVGGACEAALRSLDDAAITTLHGFASRLLADFPIEAGLPPGFAVADAPTSRLEFDRWWHDLVDELLADPSLADAWRVLLSLEIRPRRFADAARAMADNWDIVAEHPPVAPALPPGRLDPVVARLRDVLAEFRPIAPRPDKLTDCLDRLALLADDAAAERDEFGVLAVLGNEKLSSNNGQAGAWQAVGVPKAVVVDALAGVEQQRLAVVTEAAAAAMSCVLARIAAAVLADAERRRRTGELVFHDLLVLARRVLRDNASVRARLRERWRLLLVDEFQDTDPLQAEIVHLVAAASGSSYADADVGGGRLFFVGDPKQSIYRFRRADVELYRAVGERWADGLVRLQANFRSRPGIVAVLNAAFASLMASDPAQVAWTPLVAAREDVSGDPGPDVLLLGGRGADGESISAVRETEARHIAATLVRCKREGWLVGEPVRPPRPAEFRNVAILVPTRAPVGQIEDALQDAGVPYRIESRSLVWATDAVRDVVTVLQAIADPADEVAIVAALRHAGFACSDDDLVTWHAAGGRWDYLGAVPAGLVDHPVASAFACLREFHELRWWLPVNQLVERVVRERQLVELTTALPRPRDHWRRLRFVVDQARAFLDGGGHGLAEFVAWARAQIDSDADAIETVVPEPDDDAVRILTVHAAKGLEFPVVVAAGLNVDERADPHPVWSAAGTLEMKAEGWSTTGYADALSADKARAGAEAVRVLHVGLTRAADHLVVSLHHKARSTRNHARRLCDLVPELVAVGAVVEEGVPARVEPLPLPVPSPRLAEVSGDWAAFVGGRRALLAGVAAALPVTPSGLAADGDADPLASADEGSDADDAVVRRSTSGASLGSIVHRVLELADLRGDVAQLESLARFAASEVGAPGLAGEALRRAATAFSSEEVRRAAAHRHWKEAPVVATVNGRIVEGVIDLLYETDDGLVVVDYKTDAVPDEATLEAKVAHYTPQLRAYAAAVASATGRPVAGAVLLFLRSYVHSRTLSLTDVQTCERT